MYNYMSLCNIPFLTYSLILIHGFASNFVWMFLGLTPTKLLKSGMLPLFLMELGVILCNFSISSIFFSETTDQKSF